MPHVIRWKHGDISTFPLVIREPNDTNVEYAKAINRVILSEYDGELERYLDAYALWRQAQWKREHAAFKVEPRIRDQHVANPATRRSPNKPRRKTSLTCAECKKSFVTKRPDFARYCSERCHQAAYRSRNRERLNARHRNWRAKQKAA